MKQSNHRFHKIFFHISTFLAFYWHTDPTETTLSKNKKVILQHFDQLDFLIYYFLLSDEKRNKA